jgi:hypothetical protein
MFQSVLDRTVAELKARPDVLAILWCGSSATNQMGPTSDVDLHVLVDGEMRQRSTKRVDGVQVEIFFNPPANIPVYWESEERGQTLTMFAQGKVLYDPRGILANLVKEAQARYEAGPPAQTDDQIARARFFIQDAFDDAADALSAGSPISYVVLHQIFELLMAQYYRMNRRWQPKMKRLLSELNRNDGTLYELARRFLEEFGAQRKYILLKEMAAYILEPVGGLSQEYTSVPDRLEGGG